MLSKIKHKTNLILFTLIIFCASQSIAQDKIELSLKNERQKRVELSLRDSDGGTEILKLPVTFHITDKNILIMIIGNDKFLKDNSTIWLFSSTTELKDLIKKNRNVSTIRKFKKSNTELNTFFKNNDNVMLYKVFENGYECVTRTPKAIFFSITDLNQSLDLNFQFYVSNLDKKYRNILIAKCSPAKIQIKITN